MARWWVRRLVLPAWWLSAVVLRLDAQGIPVSLGDSTRTLVAPSARIGIPLRVGPSASGGGLDVASLAGTLNWNPRRLSLDSLRPGQGSGFVQTANMANASDGSASVSFASANPGGESSVLTVAWFSALPGFGGTRVTFAPTAAGNPEGTSVLSRVVARGVDVCVTHSGRWGDVNDDAAVSIIDAQQIARSSVGLPVMNPLALAGRGDVNGDGTVSILDAQQIARFSVGLGAAPRIDTPRFAEPVPSTIELQLVGSMPLVAGSSVPVRYVVRDAQGGDVTGCVPVAFSSSATAVATVSSDGRISANGRGSATITASSGTVSAAIGVTVELPAVAYRVTASSLAPAAGGSVVISAQAVDANGSPVARPNRSVTWTKAHPAGSFASPTSMTTAAGEASVVFVPHTVAGTATTVTATDDGVPAGLSGSSPTITTTPGAAAALVLATGAAGASSGAPFATQPVVLVRDAYGNTVTTSTAAVTLTVSAGGTVVGTSTVNAVAGVATFTNAGLSGLVGSYTLTYATPGLTAATQVIALTAGAPTALVVVTAPTGGAAGQPLGTQPVVELRDGAGNRSASTAAVTASVAAGNGGILTGTVTVAAVNGRATFTNLAMTGAGTFTLGFASPGLAVATAAGVTITSTGPPGIALNVGTGGTVAGTLNSDLTVPLSLDLSTRGLLDIASIEVRVTWDPSLLQYRSNSAGSWVDANGDPASTTVNATGAATGTFRVSAFANAATAAEVTSIVMRSLVFRPVAAGAAVIAATVSAAGDAAGSPILSAISTRSLTVATPAGPASALALRTSATGAASGVAFVTQPVVEVRDAGGNLVTGSTAPVTMTVSAGATVVGTGTVSAVAGVATFTNVGIAGDVGPYTLTFTAPGLAPVTQGVMVMGAATTLTLTTSAAGAASGAPFTTQPVVAVRDASGNVVTASTAPVTLTASAGGTVVGTTTVNAVAGVARFSNAGLAGLVGSYTLTFASPGMSAATQTITLGVGAPTALAVVTAPEGGMEGQPLGTQPVIEVRDGAGNRTASTAAISASLAAGTGGVLTGTGTVAAVNGRATFTDLAVTGVGTHTMAFASPGLAGATATGLTIRPAGPLGIVLNVGSAATAAGTLGSDLTVPLSLDLSAGRPLNIASVEATVTWDPTRLQYRSNAAGTWVDLNGDPAMVTVNTSGVATGTLRVSAFGNAATAAAVTTVVVRSLVFRPIASGTATIAATVSAAGNVSGQSILSAMSTRSLTVTTPTGPASALALRTTAAGAASGAAFANQPVVEVRDATGNLVTGSTVPVTLSVSAGGSLVGTSTVNAVAGVATFTTVGLAGPVGGYTLTFSAPGLTAATQPITLGAGSASALALTTSAAGAASGAAFTAQPVVAVRDASGNLVASSTTAVTLTVSAGGTLVGTGTVNAVAGVATFTNAGVAGLVGTYTLTYAAPGLPAATQTIVLAAGAPAALAVVTAPTGGVAGQPLGTQPVIEVRDGAGNRTSSTAAVTTTLSAGTGGVLTGTVTVAAVNGRAVFTNLAVSGAGTYALAFASPGLAGATAAGVTIAVAGQAGIALNVGTAATAAGTLGSDLTVPLSLDLSARGPLNIAFVDVTVTWDPTLLQYRSNTAGSWVDANGDLATTTVNAGGVSTGTFRVSALANAATAAEVTTILMRSLVFRPITSGPATISAMVTAARDASGQSILTAMSSRSLTVTTPVGPASALALRTSAAGAASGAAFATQPVVEVRDAGGTLVTASTAPVTLTVSAGGTVLGTSTVSAVAGVATFTNAGLAGVVGSYTLTFAAPGLAAATQPITLGAGAASTLALTTSAAGAASGAPFTAQPVVALRDASGNVATGSTAPVTLTASAGGTVVGTATVNAVAGVATFTNAGLAGLVGSYTLTYAAPGLVPVTQAITLGVGAPAALAVVTAPTGAAAGQPLGTQPVIEVRDGAGNRTASTATVTARVGAGSGGVLTGTVSLAAVNGRATFTNLAMTGAGTYTLAFASPGLAGATAAGVTITATGPPGMVLNVGTGAAAVGTLNSDLTVPLSLDLSTRGLLNVASILVVVSWDPTRLQYRSNAAGSWVDANGQPATVTVDASGAATGTIELYGFATEATAAAVTTILLRSLVFRPIASGTATISATVTTAGDASGGDVTTKLSTRSLSVTTPASSVRK